MVNLDLLCESAAAFGFVLTEKMKQQFCEYADFLVEYNQKVNLTAITDPDGIAVKHFLDSIAPLSFCSIPQGAVVADVGCGAGFPSVPMAIVRPDLSLRLIDGLNKRLVFLDELTQRLRLSAQTYHLRGEEAGRKAEHRDACEVVTARAVARLNTVSEYCLPLVKPGGIFLALKGPEGVQELKEAGTVLTLLSGRAEEPISYLLPDGSERILICVKKISQTSTKYPRCSAKITKSPL